MSWSLRIVNGDLVPSSRGLTVARNETKLVQDLRCFILQELGTDIYHPTYGSDIESKVGEIFQDMKIESELKRIVRLYQERQISRAKTDQVARGRISLEQGEVLVSLDDISFEQKEDRLTVNMVIKTGDSKSFNFSIGL